LRILIVTPSIPYPPNWGFGIRVYQIVRELSRHHTVSLVCYASDGDDTKIEAMAQICHSVHVVPNPLPNERAKRLAQLRSMARRSSFQTSSLNTDAMRDLLHQLLTGEQYDLVQFESSQLASLPIIGSTPWIVDEHNLEYELLRRMYETERSPLRKLYNWVEYRKFRREERSSWLRADACVVTSERERAVVASHATDTPVHLSPNGVDIDYFVADDGDVDANRIVFTGLMSYRPNIDAVTYFVQRILPLVLETKPEVVFEIVGQGPPAEVTTLEGRNVRVVGAVPDTRPYVRRAAVFVVPLRMGSGTRLKILEGLAMGKGLVTTSLGCEGIDVIDGEHVLITDGEAEFARATVTLIDDVHLAARLGRNGRALVEQTYSWSSIVTHLEVFHQQIVDSRRQG
jgi:sugar transferase (PEP-CTERM/EpsH1 system associated)